MSEKGGIQGHTPENSEKEQLELPKMMVSKFSSSPLQMGGATAFSGQQTARVFKSNLYKIDNGDITGMFLVCFSFVLLKKNGFESKPATKL